VPRAIFSIKAFIEALKPPGVTPSTGGEKVIQDTATVQSTQNNQWVFHNIPKGQCHFCPSLYHGRLKQKQIMI